MFSFSIGNTILCFSGDSENDEYIVFLGANKTANGWQMNFSKETIGYTSHKTISAATIRQTYAYSVYFPLENIDQNDVLEFSHYSILMNADRNSVEFVKAKGYELYKIKAIKFIDIKRDIINIEYVL